MGFDASVSIFQAASATISGLFSLPSNRSLPPVAYSAAVSIILAGYNALKAIHYKYTMMDYYFWIFSARKFVADTLQQAKGLIFLFLNNFCHP